MNEGKMKRKTIIILSSILSLLFTNFLLAHNESSEPRFYRGEPDSSKTFLLNPVIITGTKYKISRNDVPVSISTIGSQTLQMTNAPTVPFVLTNEVPSLFVTQRSNSGFGIGTGSAGTISMRGISGSPNTGVLVLIDGRPDYMGIFGHPLPDAYSVDNVEAIEIIRGPASYLYGTNALGGAINIITKKLHEDGFKTKLSASLGSFNTQQYKLQHGWKNSNFDYFVTGKHYNTDGHRPYTSYRSQSSSAKFGYIINGNFQIAASGNVTEFKTFNPGTVTSPLINNWAEATRGGFNIDIDNTFEEISGALKIHGNFGEHKIFDGWLSTDKVIGLMIYQNIKLSAGNISTVGFDYKTYGGKAENTISRKDFGRHFITEYAPYVHTQQFIYDFVATAALRLENNSIFGSEIVPHFGLNYKIDESANIRGVVSKGFRSPTIREVYLFPAPTLTLKPERVWNYEVGFSKRFFHLLYADITVYQNEGSNLIRTEGVFPNLKLTNSGKFKHRGVEVELKSRITETLFLSANYSYLDPQNETFASPGNKLGAQVNYSMNDLSLNINGTYVSQLYGKDLRQQKLGDFIFVNSMVAYRLTGYLSASLAVENLLNKSYQLIYGYPMPHRNFTISLSTNF